MTTSTEHFSVRGKTKKKWMEILTLFKSCITKTLHILHINTQKQCETCSTIALKRLDGFWHVT